MSDEKVNLYAYRALL